MGTMAKGIAYNGVPVAWMLKINKTSGAIADPDGTTAADVIRLDNLSEQPKMTLRSPASSSSTEYFEFPRGDSATIKFEKTTVDIDGTDESTMTSTEDADSGYAKATLVINEADIDSDTYTDLVQKIKTSLYSSEYWLVVIPTAATWDSINVQGTPNADGFFYCVMQMDSDIEVGTSPVTINLTSVKLSGTDVSTTEWETAVVALDFTGHGITPPNYGSVTILPDNLSTAYDTDLYAGKAVILDAGTAA